MIAGETFRGAVAAAGTAPGRKPCPAAGRPYTIQVVHNTRLRSTLRWSWSGAGSTAMNGVHKTYCVSHWVISCVLLCAAAGSCTGAGGTVELPWDRFELMYTAGEKYQTARGAKGKCALPDGCYVLRYITLIAEDDQRRNWRMRSGSLSVPLNVVAGRTIKLDVDPPFTARVTVSRNRVESGRSVEIGLELVDGTGRTFSPPRSRSGRPEKPAVVLRHSDGREITTLGLEYG